MACLTLRSGNVINRSLTKPLYTYIYLILFGFSASMPLSASAVPDDCRKLLYVEAVLPKLRVVLEKINAEMFKLKAELTLRSLKPVPAPAINTLLHELSAELEPFANTFRNSQWIAKGGENDKMKRILAGSIHDLCNDLNPIYSYLHLMNSGDIELLIDGAAVCLRRSESAMNWIDAILDPEFVRSGGSTQIADLADAVNYSDAPQVVDNQIKVVSTLGTSARQMFGNPTLLRAMIRNLVINGAKAIAAHPRREVGTGLIQIKIEDAESAFGEVETAAQTPFHGRLGPGIIISVQDNGIGMTPEEMRTAFIFGETSGGGRGYGLSSISTVVEDHGGELTATSEKFKGTTFFIYLPFKKAPKTSPQIASPAEDERATLPLNTIVVAEPYPDTQTSAVMLLRLSGYRDIATVESWEDLITLVRSNHTQIRGIMLEFVMPMEKGKSVQDYMNELDTIDPGFAKRIFITTSIPQRIAPEWAAKFGGVATKPYNMDDFITALEKMPARIAPGE